MTSYGTVTIGDRTYIERTQTFPMEVTVNLSLGQFTGTLQLPGTADFWLKSLTRVTVVAGVNTPSLFKFRLGNTDGSTWYQSGGTGGTPQRVLDPLLFGTGQFPFVLTPYIYYSASGGINWEVEDVTNTATGTPYTIFFGFQGSYLIPANTN